MDDKRLNLDLILLNTTEHFKHTTWTWDDFGRPNFIKIIGAFKLDEGRFNLPYCNLLIPVPTNIYDPAGKDKFHFYRYVYVDENLKIRGKRNHWRNLNRGYAHNLYQEDEIPSQSGWQWICYMNPVCGPNDNILSLIASVQNFMNNDA